MNALWTSDKMCLARCQEYADEKSKNSNPTGIIDWWVSHTWGSLEFSNCLPSELEMTSRLCMISTPFILFIISPPPPPLFLFLLIKGTGLIATSQTQLLPFGLSYISLFWYLFLKRLPRFFTHINSDIL